MENENNRNYLDERKSSGENNPPSLDPEKEIKSGPKKELLGSSSGAGALKNNSNEVLDAVKKKKSKDLTIPIVLGVVLLMVVMVVAGFYLLKDKDIPVIGGESPQQKILNSSLIAMSDVESYSFEGDFNLSFTESDKEGFSLAMKFDGQADGSDTDNIKSSLNAKPEITVSEEGGSENISFDFSMKSFGKLGEETAYFKLNDFDLGMAGMVFGEMIIPYKDKWYSLDMKELQEMGGASMEMEKDFNPEEMIDKIKELFKKYEMIKFQKDLGDAKLSEVDVYHYQVGVDPEAVLDFYVEMLKTSPFLISGATDDELENFEEELEENREEILTVLDEIMANTKTEIWIGEKDKMIYKIAISGEFDDEFAERLKERMEEINKDKYNEISIYDKILFTNTAMAMRLPSPSKSQPFELSFDMTITMSNFNQPINISKPEESESLMKVLEEMMMGFMGGMMMPEIGSGDDSDKDGLTDEMEAFYGTDPNNPDTDGDGFSDGNEVSRGYDPLLPGEAKLDYDRLFKY